MFRRALLIIAIFVVSLTIITSCDILTKPAERCATPFFSPASGQYLNAQNVSITCATIGATIVYTVDGSDPTSGSTVYTSPIEITAITTVKAKAMNSSFKDSHIASATYTIGTVQSQFVCVPGGTFTMGNTLGGGISDELPTHSVTLSAFYIGKYEVTQSEWQTIMGSIPASGNGVGDNYPVYYVSWYSAIKYCNLLSMAESLTPAYTISGSTNPTNWGTVPDSANATWDAAICNWSANGYRLPTEAEWEYAARGGTTTPDYVYSGSDDIDVVAWYDGNNTPSGTKQVGQLQANSLGIYDMSGNVNEWCWDWYSFNYYSSSPSNNPTGSDSGISRLLRGGSWRNNANSCRVSSRYSFPYNNSIIFIGFRLVRVN